MNSSMATTHSQMAEMERMDQECRTTTGARVKGARPQGGGGLPAARQAEPAPATPSSPQQEQPLSPGSLPPPWQLLPDALKGALLMPPLSQSLPKHFPSHVPPVCGSIPTVSKILPPLGCPNGTL